MPDDTRATSPQKRMPVDEALQVIVRIRDNRIVVTNQSSARLWPRLCQDALDFNYNPSTMGGAIPFALGLALAQPRREIIVLSGDGSLLMSLGSLVSVIDSGAANLSVVLLDNGIYEVTGGQRTPASGAGVDFAGLAKSTGFPNVAHFSELEVWSSAAVKVLNSQGPRFVWLEVGRTPAEAFEGSPESLAVAERLQRLTKALQAGEDQVFMRARDGGDSRQKRI